MSAARRNITMLALVLAGWLTLTLGCWIVTRVAFAASARRLLAVHFVGRLGDPAREALSIWLHNSKMTAGVAVCIALVAAVRRMAPAGRAGAERIPMWLTDTILGVWSLLWVALAGVALGAYGAVQLRAFLPDGPVEITAWALLLALYINARRGQGGWRQAAWGLVSVEALLALAAILEAWGPSL